MTLPNAFRHRTFSSHMTTFPGAPHSELPLHTLRRCSFFALPSRTGSQVGHIHSLRRYIFHVRELLPSIIISLLRRRCVLLLTNLGKTISHDDLFRNQSLWIAVFTLRRCCSPRFSQRGRIPRRLPSLTPTHFI